MDICAQGKVFLSKLAGGGAVEDSGRVFVVIGEDEIVMAIRVEICYCGTAELVGVVRLGDADLGGDFCEGDCGVDGDQWEEKEEEDEWEWHCFVWRDGMGCVHDRDGDGGVGDGLFVGWVKRASVGMSYHR